jgi:hypothetical protein
MNRSDHGKTAVFIQRVSSKLQRGAFAREMFKTRCPNEVVVHVTDTGRLKWRVIQASAKELYTRV